VIATFDALGIEVYATCPPSTDVDADRYVERVVDVARWSERHGCRGILVYTDGRLVDPWLVSHVIVQHTARLAPLVAVQPLYMHPYTAAKMVASFAFLHRRRLDLNMVAGGFKNDLASLADPTDHDERYTRLTEYSAVIQRLLAGGPPLTFEGRFYRLDRVRLTPPLAPELMPGFFVSGSSPAGRAAARAIGAVAVQYPEPAGVEEPADCRRAEDPGGDDVDGRSGVRIGIVARRTEAEAWRVAWERFPADRQGQLTHELAMKVSDSSWHHKLSAHDAAAGRWWLHPFKNYKTFCPYLVGAYEAVADELARFVVAGRRTFILDIPPDEDELGHTARAFGDALTIAATAAEVRA
jgi:alkanesulfonate monooxygenase